MAKLTIEAADRVIIDFPSLFTTEQIEYIGQCVVDAARDACGNDLRDVILYGSYARGDYREWSDVDIMVLANADDT
ncbi:MAG: nucleotidyltransferase domain-containing protein, partial [Clostridiales bacterium]|nr:nucleotidyltransferase domain-containing protein [Clostridiales bacterium]